jgi:hypothetical protein
VIPGAHNETQLAQNVAASNGAGLPADALAAIAQVQGRNG